MRNFIYNILVYAINKANILVRLFWGNFNVKFINYIKQINCLAQNVILQ